MEFLEKTLAAHRESAKYTGDDNARAVLAKRYLIKDEDGNPVETAEDMFSRVAKTIALVDAKYGSSPEQVADTAGEFYRLMVSGVFEPNSPTLMNAGRPLGQLSACFVLPVADALSNGKDGIYDTLKDMAIIHQSGGGTGFSFSGIRPAGAMVRSTTGVASGPISFMSLFDYSTEVVKQGGTRRGANMGILRVDHPDILEFISCKADTSKIRNFNISIAVTDEFMRAADEDRLYTLYDHNGFIAGETEAKYVLDQIIEHAWATGEPGLFFIDEANYYNPVPHLGKYEATNPCGEQPLLPYDVCNLGSINVGTFVDFNGKFRWEEYERVIHRAVHFLDNVIDANHYPLEQIDELSKRIRRIGLGIMGFADALIRLRIPYDSPQAVEFAEKLMSFTDDRARYASEAIAAARGAFPEWEQSIWGPDATCARDAAGNRVREEQWLRNSNITTIAPTGTISMIAGCSSGIEPLFAVAFYRNQAEMRMIEYNEDFKNLLLQRFPHDEVDAILKEAAETGHVPEKVPEHIRKLFVTAHEVTPEQHVRIQAAFQRYNDSAISKTINFPHSATKEQVREAYLLGWDLGLKGITVYRDGSREEQVLSTGATVQLEAERCEQCGSENLRHEGGCVTCIDCQISACKLA